MKYKTKILSITCAFLVCTGITQKANAYIDFFSYNVAGYIVPQVIFKNIKYYNQANYYKHNTPKTRPYQHACQHHYANRDFAYMACDYIFVEMLKQKSSRNHASYGNCLTRMQDNYEKICVNFDGKHKDD